MKTETEWAIRNLELAGFFKKDSDYEGMIGTAVKRLLLIHQTEGHSGYSHSLVAHLFKAVALGEALTVEWWQERFEAFNKFAKEQGGDQVTEEEFEKLYKKPTVTGEDYQ